MLEDIVQENSTENTEEERICFIRLTGKRGAGKVAVINLEDALELGKSFWHLKDNGYASRGVWSREKKRTLQEYMHQILCPTDQKVDHENRNKLDNRRSNLRPTTNRQNSVNREKTKTTSRYIGVSYAKTIDEWSVGIQIKGKQMRLGTFRNESDAALAYDAAVYHFDGATATRNFPNQIPPAYPYRVTKTRRRQATGVYLDRFSRGKPWRAKIQCPVRKKPIHIGRFATKEEAVIAFEIAKELMAVASFY